MRVLVHDHSGHPFQVQLSRELSRRGHVVTHSYCAAYVSGKGHLVAGPEESLVFDPIGVDTVAEKNRFARRLLQEVRWGFDLIRQVRRTRPDVVLVSNAQIPTLIVFSLAMAMLRVTQSPASPRNPAAARPPSSNTSCMARAGTAPFYSWS